VSDFLEEASATGLTYLGDAIPAATAFELLPDDARERARSLPSSAAQQLVDFVRWTSFRRALLVRSEAARAASWSAPRELDSDGLRRLRVTSRLRPGAPEGPAQSVESFEADEGEGVLVVQVSDPDVRRALRALADAAPRSLAFDELAGRSANGSTKALDEANAKALASELLDAWLATSAIDLHVHEPRLRSVAGERPIACPVARWHAAHGGVITNRLHQEVLVPDAFVRWVLARLDGTRTRSDLAREARSEEAFAAVTDAELEVLAGASLDRLVACALVIGDFPGDAPGSVGVPSGP
jgi:Predicted methyltransferase regulatory domain